MNNLSHKICAICFSRSSSPEVFLGKGVLKICSKFTGEHPCRSVISIKLLCNNTHKIPLATVFVSKDLTPGELIFSPFDNPLGLKNGEVKTFSFNIHKDKLS